MQEVEKKKREVSSSGFLGNSIKSTYDNSSSSSSTYDQNSTVFVELGAGKGLLGLAVSCIKVRHSRFHSFSIIFFICCLSSVLFVYFRFVFVTLLVFFIFVLPLFSDVVILLSSYFTILLFRFRFSLFKFFPSLPHSILIFSILFSFSPSFSPPAQINTSISRKERDEKESG